MRSECISEEHRRKHKQLEWPFKLLVMQELHSQGHKLQAKVVWEILMCKDYIGATNVPKESETGDSFSFRYESQDSRGHLTLTPSSVHTHIVYTIQECTHSLVGTPTFRKHLGNGCSNIPGCSHHTHPLPLCLKSTQLGMCKGRWGTTCHSKTCNTQ